MTYNYGKQIRAVW